MSFASNLKRIMNERCISQVELADMTGVSKSGISQYLSGKYQPKGKIIEALAAALDCTADELTADEVPDILKVKNVTTEQAAKMLGVSKEFVRIGLQKKTLPIGTAIKMSSRYTYVIPPKKLLDYMNRSGD